MSHERRSDSIDVQFELMDLIQRGHSRPVGAQGFRDMLVSYFNCDYEFDLFQYGSGNSRDWKDQDPFCVLMFLVYCAMTETGAYNESKKEECRGNKQV